MALNEEHIKAESDKKRQEIVNHTNSKIDNKKTVKIHDQQVKIPHGIVSDRRKSYAEGTAQNNQKQETSKKTKLDQNRNPIPSVKHSRSMTLTDELKKTFENRNGNEQPPKTKPIMPIFSPLSPKPIVVNPRPVSPKPAEKEPQHIPINPNSISTEKEKPRSKDPIAKTHLKPASPIPPGNSAKLHASGNGESSQVKNEVPKKPADIPKAPEKDKNGIDERGKEFQKKSDADPQKPSVSKKVNVQTGNNTGSVVVVGSVNGNISVTNTAPAPRNSVLESFKKGNTLVPWQFPQISANYIPRFSLTEQLKKIHEDQSSQIKKADKEQSLKSIITVCAGMSGSGKTQLVLDYAMNAVYGIKVYFWVDKNLDQSLLAYAKHLGFERETADLMVVSGYIKEKLALRKDWLLIFDNIENLKELMPHLPEGGHIILTTRNMECLERNVHKIKVDAMTPDESFELFSSYHENEIKNKKEVMQLLEKLDYLPLAISQAASYIVKSEKPILDYLRLFSENPWSVLSVDSGSDPSVVKTIDNSLRSILAHDKTKEKFILMILRAFSMLHFDAIPKKLLLRWFELVCPSSMLEQHSPEVIFDLCLLTLKQYYWVKEKDQCYTIHPLVQLVLFAKRHALIQASEKDVKSGILPHQNGSEDYLRLAQSLLDENIFGSTSQEKGDYHDNLLIRHFKVLIDLYNRMIEKPNKETEKMYIKLLKTYADKLIIFQANINEAEKIYECALKLEVENSGTVMRMVLVNQLITIRDYLFNVVRTQELAITLQARILEIIKEVDINDAPNLLKFLEDNILPFYKKLEDHQKVKDHKTIIEYYELKLKIQEKIESKDNLEIFVILNKLMALYLLTGENQKVIILLERAQKIYEGDNGSHLKRDATSLFNIGTIYKYLGDPRRAIEPLQKCLEIRLSFFNKVADKITKQKNRLKDVIKLLDATYNSLKDDHEKSEIIKRAIEFRAKAFGSNHKYVTSLKKLLSDNNAVSEPILLKFSPPPVPDAYKIEVVAKLKTKPIFHNRSK